MATANGTEEKVVTIGGEALDTLQHLAAAKNKSVDQILGDAVALERFVTEARESGGRLFVMDEKGTLHEVAVP